MEQRNERRKGNEETREWIEEIIQDFPKKLEHQTHHHQETRWSLSQVRVEEMIDGVEENEREEMKEGGQGMEVIEKTKLEGDKSVVVERVRRRMKRGMD